MADSRSPITRDLVADYLNVGASGAEKFELMATFETIDENPNAQTTEKHYTANKSASVITAGYKTQFPIVGDMYRNDAVMEYLRDIAEEQKLGIETDFVRVRLYQPIESKAGVYYARKFRVGFEISSISGSGGELMSLDGNMNAQSDAIVGEFDIKTKTFTAKE